MSQNRMLVVVDNKRYRGVIGSLAKWGYNTIIVDNMLTALDKIHHHHPVAVIVNGNGEIDILEFVLSVNEVDDSLPIILMKISIEKLAQKALEEKSTVHIVPNNDNENCCTQLKETLQEVELT